MSVARRKGFKISRTGRAKQLIINSHGGWIKSDGFTQVPKNTTLMFYASHGDFTLGYKVVSAVLSNPNEAKIGLKKTISPGRLNEIGQKVDREIGERSQDFLKLQLLQADLDAVINAPSLEAGNRAEDLLRARVDAKIKELVAEKKMVPAIGEMMRRTCDPARLNRQKRIEEIRSEELGNTCGLTDKFGGGNHMFNYALSKETDPDRKKYDKENFALHKRGGPGIPMDVDLLQIKTTDSRHLSDVFDAVARYNYEIIHFGACRVPYGETPNDAVRPT